EPSPARRSLGLRADWYRDRLVPRHPGLSDRLDALVDRIGRDLRDAPGPTAAVHGDLHLGQLLQVRPGGPLAVLDLDTGGLGDPADDDAALWAHLLATAYRAV